MTHPSVFQRVADDTASPALFLDPGGRPTAWNRAADRLGLVVRFGAAARNGPAAGDVYSRLARGLVGDGCCLEAELLVLREGLPVRLRAHGSPIRDGDGEPLGAVVVFERSAVSADEPPRRGAPLHDR